MGYRQLIFDSKSEEFLALLSLFEFQAFEETDDSIIGFIEIDYCTPAFYHDLNVLCQSRDVKYSENDIESINWNEEWESSFNPVVVGSFCTVRATFHTDPIDTDYAVTVDPKMAFGTGHHETTFMMIEWMEKIDFQNKVVLDHGCGTGVLAILAEKCGSIKIDAVDIEEDAYSNAVENINLNHCQHINPVLGTIGDMRGNNYDIILANINRNVLMNSCHEQFSLLSPGGILCISGVLKSDKDVVLNAFEKAGFIIEDIKTRGEWISIKFNR